jgi:hypothetical protein
VAQAATLTTNLTAAQKTKYQAEFLRHFKERLLIRNFGQTSSIAHAEGATVDWFRYRPLAKVTAASSEGLTTFTYKALSGMAITATVEEWGDQISFAMLHWATSRDRHLDKGSENVATQAAESLERETWFQLQRTGILPLHPRAVNTSGAVDASWLAQNVKLTSATSTTAVRLSDSMMGLSGKAINDAFNGGWMCVQGGANYGFASRIADYASASRVLTLSTAAGEAYQSAGNTYPSEVTLVSPFRSALANTDTIHTALISKAVSILRKGGAKPFEDGYYAGIFAPEIEDQLMGTAAWRETAYRAAFSKSEGLVPAEVMVWGGVKWHRATYTARYVTTAKTMNAYSQTAGNVFMTLILGKDAFGIPAIEGMGEPQLSIKIPTPDDNNTSNPRNTFGTMGWTAWWKVKPLNANFAVAIFSYAA